MRATQAVRHAMWLAIVWVVIGPVCVWAEPPQAGLPVDAPQVRVLSDAPQIGEKPATATVHVRVDVSRPLRPRTRAVLGFSMEKSVMRSGRLRSNNQALVAMMRLLGPGTLRLGGNSVDEMGPCNAGEIDALLGLARAAGWQVIYGLNLGADKPDEAAREAREVWSRGRDAVLAFEIGNEPDMFVLQGLRGAGWDPASYLRQFARYRQNLGDLPVSGPGAGSIYDSARWTLPFLEAQGRGLAFASVHFYPTVARTPLPPDSPAMPTLAHLLSPRIANAISSRCFIPQIEAAQRLGLPFRVTEANTAARSGQPGLSDTFAAALWIVDWTLRLQLLGVDGIDVQCDPLNAHDLYTPLLETREGLEARPIFYGMLLLAQLREGRFVATSVDASAPQVRAYAVAGRTLQVVLINTGEHPADVRLDAPGTKATALRLAAPSITARDGIMLGGSAVKPDGAWTPQSSETLARDADGAWQVQVPAGNAALLEITTH